MIDAKITSSKLLHIRIKNYGILKDVETDISEFNIFLGKNKIGKTTLIKALKLLESFITNDIPLEYANFYGMLRKTNRKDNLPVILAVGFNIETDPPEFSGEYYYCLEVNLEAIQREILIAKKGNITKFYDEKEITLVERNVDKIKYYRMLKQEGGYNFELDERNTPANDKVSTSLLWDYSREPYMKVIKNYLKEIGGFETEMVLKSRLRLINDNNKKMQYKPPIDQISLLLHDINSKDKDVIKKLNYYFKLLYEDFVEFKIQEDEYADTIFMIENQGNEKVRIPAYYVSKGTKNLIILLADCLLAEKFSASKVFLIDEIENSLHPKIIEKLLEILKTIDLQFIITTHHPVVIRYLKEDDIKIMYKENELVKISKGYNRTMLAEDFHIDVNELDIMKFWLDGDDTDLIIHDQ